jgi:hypothetical protein
VRNDGTIHVVALWDDVAKVWYATSKDVPGLAMEAATMEELQVRLEIAVPELLELNRIPLAPIELFMRGQSAIPLHA